MGEMFFLMYVNAGLIKLLSFLNSSFSSLSLCDSEVQTLLQNISQILQNIINICCISAGEIFLQTFVQPCSICCSAERSSKLWSLLLIYRDRIQRLFKSVQQDCVNICSYQLDLLATWGSCLLNTAVKRKASFYSKEGSAIPSAQSKFQHTAFLSAGFSLAQYVCYILSISFMGGQVVFEIFL